MVIGAALSMYLARCSWYQAQVDEVKRLLAYGMTAVVAILAYIAVTYVPAMVWGALSPYWVILVFTAFAIFGNQGWFQLAIKTARGAGQQKWLMLGETPDLQEQVRNSIRNA